MRTRPICIGLWLNDKERARLLEQCAVICTGGASRSAAHLLAPRETSRAQGETRPGPSSSGASIDSAADKSERGAGGPFS